MSKSERRKRTKIVALRMSPEQRRALMSVAFEEGLSLSELLRRGLVAWTEESDVKDERDNDNTKS